MLTTDYSLQVCANGLMLTTDYSLQVCANTV